MISSSSATACGLGRASPANAFPAQPGSAAASAVTRRPASKSPSKASTGTSTAIVNASSRTRPYQGRTRSQKCSPIVAWLQATTSTISWSAPSQGDRTV